jgi:hypothetical protein
LEYRINGTAYVKYYKSVASAGFSISYYDRNYDDSHSAAKEAAISGARSAFSFGSKSEAYSDARIGASSELLELSSSDPGWQAMLSATRLKFALEGSWTLMAPHCVLKMYAYSSAPSNGEYNKFGENVPAQDVFSVIKSLDKPQGTRNIESGWIPSDTLMPTFGGGAGIRGFVLKNLEVTAVFDFVYK